MGAEAKNLEVIAKAIDQHNSGCPFPAVSVVMNPFEVERLGWDSIRGLPIESDPKMGTGEFRIVCGGDHDGGADEAVEEVDAVADQVVPISR